MTKIIAISNQKGGVGKTTSAVNLAASVAAAERRVLLMDLDPQGNASSGLGLDRGTYADKNIYHVLIDELPIREAIYPTDLKFLKVCPSDSNLSGAEVELVQAMAREMRLRNAFEEIREKNTFDYVFIDCPPSLGLLTLNALAASDYFLIPLQCEYYAMEGLGQFLHTAELIRKGLNKNLKQLGILLTMYDSRNNLSRQVVNEVKAHFKDSVFDTVIPRNVKLSESPSHGKPVILYDISSTGSQSYLNLAEEVILRLEGPQEKAVPKAEIQTETAPAPTESVETVQAAPQQKAQEEVVKMDDAAQTEENLTQEAVAPQHIEEINAASLHGVPEPMTENNAPEEIEAAETLEASEIPAMPQIILEENRLEQHDSGDNQHGNA